MPQNCLKHPRVSVIMSVYNGAHYLEECIQSVLDQSFKDFEFIIINDGSTDNTLNIITRFDDSRIKVLSNQINIGLTKSLNRGLRRAKGEYIARIDADDYCFPYRLSKQAKYLDENFDYIAVGTGVVYVDEKGQRIGAAIKPLTDAELKFMLLFYSPFVHPTVMFRSSVNETKFFYDEKYAVTQDYALWGKIAEYGKFANIGECLVAFRKSNYKITSLRRFEQIANHKKISFSHVSKRESNFIADSTSDAWFKLILTDNQLNFKQMKELTLYINYIAEIYGTTSSKSIISRQIASEFIFNHTLRKRGIKNGLSLFLTSVFYTKGLIILNLLMRIPNIIKRFCSTKCIIM